MLCCLFAALILSASVSQSLGQPVEDTPVAVLGLGSIRGLDLSPDGRQLAVNYSDGVRLYDAVTLAELADLGRGAGDPPPILTTFSPLAVYGVGGQRVRVLSRGLLAAGAHSVSWDGTDDQGRVVASGVYFWRLVVDGRSWSGKILLMHRDR